VVIVSAAGDVWEALTRRVLEGRREALLLSYRCFGPRSPPGPHAMPRRASIQ
jgi:hypothetical protein